MKSERSEKGNIYSQVIHQHGDGNITATVAHEIATNQTAINDFPALVAGLSTMREHFKSLNTLEADEYAGLLAQAQKAAQEKDEGKLLKFVKAIPSKAWDLSKPLLSAALSHFLIAQGILPT